MSGLRTHLRAACAVLALACGATSPASAYKMLQNVDTGRTSAGFRVACNDPSGFAHWTTSNVTFHLNPAGQGADKAGALYNAMNAWNFVSGTAYTPTYAGTTSAGFATDGINSLSWGTDSGCITTPFFDCYALTALVLQPGQVIVEADVIFRSDKTWRTDGGALDTWSVAEHEIGHTLGIHHSEFGSATMYENYFGTGMRSLEVDDGNALRCSQSRYAPANTCVPDGGVDDILGTNSCCSGWSVEGSAYCTNPSDYNHGWASCHQICATPQVLGCVPSGGVDDIGINSHCCSGASVPNSARCLNPADWGGTWKTCIQTCL